MEIFETSGRSKNVDIVEEYFRRYDEQIEKFKKQEPDLKNWLKAPTKKTEDDIVERRDRGAQMCLTYLGFVRENPFDLAYVDEFTPAIELEFEIEIGGIPVKGAIDLVIDLGSAGAQPVDLKTGNREATNFQLAIYKHVLEKTLSWKVRRASYFYAKDAKIVTLDEKQLARYSEQYLTELITTLDRGITERVYLPNPGQQCKMCPVQKYCREKGYL